MNVRPEDISCPVCGYYCIGTGGHGCIDKPSFFNTKTDTAILKVKKTRQEILEADEQIGKLKVSHSRINELIKRLNESGVA